MSLEALLAGVDPRWHDATGDALDAGLLERARGSRLGRRLLVGALQAGPAAHLLAPSPDGFAGLIERWSPVRLAALHRDLGVLAYAPAIRAEVSRDAVKRLKTQLAGSYLLALDRSIWDARVDPALQASLCAALTDALASASPPHGLFDLLELQGRAELQAWAAQREPALADWARLIHPPTELPTAHLPEKPLLVVHAHHYSRAIAA
ncbi:hypothetical protein [Luteimonas sp. 100069]|uniref:hypothetical protein n=1 Tax=Luteimonas sp. 100069 TaxID=2006109 RepID=UPI000F4FDB11|nr:hypothetical protein [Luteimonas sp. 100069]RPD85444.1 hypothetical protein EGK76_11190 [Luteimonas sp. 100069]